MGKRKIMSVQQGGLGILPSDILFQVLSKLPPKALLKFRGVSKQWLDLIYDPFFINLHSNESKNKPFRLGVYYDHFNSRKYKITIVNPLDDSSAEDFYLSFPCDTYRIMYCSGHLVFYGVKNIHTCNPSTRQVSTIDHNLSSQTQICFHDNYGVGPNKILTGFGYLPSTSQYKVIDLYTIGIGLKREFKACILTLPSKNAPGNWMCIPVRGLDCSDDMTHYQWGITICVNGIIYWQKFSSVKTGAKPMCKVITFDLEVQEFRLLTCPLIYTRNHYGNRLFDLNGEVCLLDLMSSEHLLNIWILKDSKNEIWAKEYTVNYPSTLHGWPVVPFIVQDGYGEKKLIFESSDGNFYLCNLKHKTFTKVAVVKMNTACKFIHYNSLVPTTL